MEWLSEWIREKEVKKAFPREYGLERKIIYDKSNIKENGADKYLSVFSLWQVRMNFFDVVFIDIDGNGDEAYYNYKDVRRLLKDYDLEPSVVYFSGRGFHIYFWFESFVFNDYGETVRKFIEMVGLKDYVDMHVIGDKRRMARIPHTYNSKTGMWVMKINPSWVWVEIKGRSKLHDEYNVGWKRNELVGKILREIDDDNEVNEFKDWDFEGVENEHSIVDEYLAGGKNFPKCVENWMKELEESGELDHNERLNLAIYLLHIWGYEKTYEYFKRYANDFKSRYTEYQLKYIKRRKLKMFKCSRMREIGICPLKGKDCPFYPTLNAWVKWR